MTTCPNCGVEGSYIGIRTIECPNYTCKHYTKKQETENRRRIQETIDAEPKSIDIDTDTKEIDYDNYAD